MPAQITRYIFKQESLPQTGVESSSITAADVDGDGHDDLIVVSFNGIEVMINNGDGTFQNPVVTPKLEFSFGSPAFGDFNHDGKVDLALPIPTIRGIYPVFPGQAGRVLVYLGRGDGTFASPVPYLPGVDCASVLAADLNGDGTDDLVAVGNSAQILLGMGDGTFSAGALLPLSVPSIFAATADLNGDGVLDLVVATQWHDLNVLIGKGDGTFGFLSKIIMTAMPSAIVMGDFNHDGRVDMAVSAYFLGFEAPGGIFVFKGNGSGSFEPPRQLARTLTECLLLTASDFNGDNHLDLALVEWTEEGQSFVILQGRADGGFSSPVRIATRHPVQSVMNGDFNSDGKGDLAIIGFGGQGTVLLSYPNRKITPLRSGAGRISKRPIPLH